MGGLLAAEVATANSEQPKRVIGLVAFDVPFLGMHPHVIISGIASLLPGDKDDKEKTEAEMNDKSIVRQVHSDDVESAKSVPTEGLYLTLLLSSEIITARDSFLPHIDLSSSPRE